MLSIQIMKNIIRERERERERERANIKPNKLFKVVYTGAT
jgi:hypothetical protein